MVVSEWYGDLRVLYLIVQRDLPDVLACERLASQTAWSRKDFLDAFKDRSVVALVVEHEGDVVGFMVYRLVPDSVLVLKLAVLPDYQRMKIGTLLMNQLIPKLSPQRPSLYMVPLEDNLPGVYFLLSLGFKISHHKGEYLGEYTIQPEDIPRHRMTRYLAEAGLT